MWVPSAVVDWFHISKQAVESLREELSVARAERELLKLQLANSENHFNWLRVRVNSLEIERAQLIEKAYGIKIPVPEITKPQLPIQQEITPDIFTDMGDDLAKTLGLPVYSN